MKKIEIIAPLPQIKDVVDLVQRRGVIELTKPEKNDALQHLSAEKSAARYEKYLSVVSAALKEIEKRKPEKKSLAESFIPKMTDLTLSEYLLRSDEADETLNLCYSINDAVKEITEATAAIARNKAMMDSLTPWLSLDLPMKYSGTRTTAAFIGTLPAAYTAESLKAALLPILGETDTFECEIISAAKGRTNALVLCHTECKQAVFNALRELGFAYPSDPTKHPPEVRFERYKKLNEDLELAIKTNKEKLEAWADKREQIRFAEDYFTVCKEKYSSIGSLGVTDSVFVLTGYIAEKNARKLTDELNKTFDVAISLTDPGEDEDVPVLLQNNGFSGAVESITKMYSLPGKDDVDPNPVMAFFYYALFGIMLSDAGYGALMVLGTLFVKLKWKPQGNLKKTVDMYFYCGIATVFWGALFGSWFGDIFNVVAEQFFNKDIGSLALWFEPVNDPMKLMLYSFLFGIIHLFVGLGVSFCNIWRHGNKLGAVCDVIPVYLFITGLAPLGASIVITVPPAVTTVGKYLMIAGAVLIVATAGRSSKNIIGKFGLGLYGLYNVASGWLSDILSYSRLLALGLCTGVIAQVVNTLGTIPENKVTKLCLLIPVFIFGHTVNMAINLIGTYVHTNRLQYVEFFAKFYEGGGRSFTPLTAHTKHYNIKED